MKVIISVIVLFFSINFASASTNDNRSQWTVGQCVEVQSGVFSCIDEKQSCYTYRWTDAQGSSRISFSCLENESVKKAEVLTK